MSRAQQGHGSGKLPGRVELVHVTDGYLNLLPPSHRGRKTGAGVQVLGGTIHSFGGLEFSQANQSGGPGVIPGLWPCAGRNYVGVSSHH